MSRDLLDPQDIETAPPALDEFRTTQEEFSDFFGDVFDELQNLSLELFARHKCLEVTAEERAAATGGQREELLRAIDQLQQLHGQLQADHEEAQQAWTEIHSSCRQFAEERAELGNLRESLHAALADFTAARESVESQRSRLQEQCAAVESHLERLTSLAAELAEARTQPSAASDIAAILENAGKQQAQWSEQRKLLEAEIESMRRRVAEQTEAMSEQKRQAAQQQAELLGEVKRMRSLLDALAGQVRGEPAAAEGARQLSQVDSSVLGTVLAQFEMLQRDISGRRAQRHSNPGKA